MKDSIKTYFFNLLIWIDQGFNTILGGSPDHTISGRVGFHSMQGKTWAIYSERVINTLFFDKEHCINSIEWFVMRRHYPEVLVDKLEKQYYEGIDS